MILNTDLGSWEEDNFRVTCFNGNKLFVVGSLLNMFLFSLGGGVLGVLNLLLLLLLFLLFLFFKDK